MKICFLGTGSSAGTPVIGCSCSVCTGRDPYNCRSRASILVSQDKVNLLVDTGPDFRYQALREGIPRLTAVFYTHFHADHINGIDDLRAFNFLQQEIIPCYADPRTAGELERRFQYCFLPPDPGWTKPSLSMKAIEDALDFSGLLVQPVPVMHGNLPIYGYRFNDAAYLTDLKSLPDSSLPLLENLELLILDCLRIDSHPTHLNLEEAVTLARRIGARRTLLTHMTHDLDFYSLADELPPGIEPAYDGLSVSL